MARKDFKGQERENMEFRSFLIKYGEIGVKGKNRWKFEDVLIRQVKTALRKVDGTFDIVR